MERKNAWTTYDEKDLQALEDVSKGYRAYLDGGKTERECVKETLAQAREAGYIDLAQAVAAGRKLKAGDKVYVNCMGKADDAVPSGRRRPWKRELTSWAHTSIPPASTLSRIPSMRTPPWPMLTPITMAASRNSTGWPGPWPSTAWWRKRTARWWKL